MSRARSSTALTRASRSRPCRWISRSEASPSSPTGSVHELHARLTHSSSELHGVRAPGGYLRAELRTPNGLSAREIRPLVAGKEHRLRRCLRSGALAGLARLERGSQPGPPGERGDPLGGKLRDLAGDPLPSDHAGTPPVQRAEADQHAPHAWSRGLLLRGAAPDPLCRSGEVRLRSEEHTSELQSRGL